MSRSDTSVEGIEEAHTPLGIEVIAPREVPLGGIRAMTVRRTLPTRGRTTIGAWCFLDHYGPDPIDITGGMVVPPHPHIGLQTVSWLFQGEIKHRDSVGTEVFVRPGMLNLMTAGHGIQHLEVSTGSEPLLHGVQLWLALPGRAREVQPRCDVRDSVEHAVDGATIRVFIGALPGLSGVDAPLYSAVVGAELHLRPQSRLVLEVDASFEHGLLVDNGEIRVEEVEIPRYHLGYFPTGRQTIELVSGEIGARVLLIGGRPFEEEIVMWWNFIGRSHDEVSEARAQWQSGLSEGSARFGRLEGMEPLPAPEMPSVRLRPRGGPRPANPR
jgi:redox-sensitive bicupin YhaK (pirin superfamily)